MPASKLPSPVLRLMQPRPPPESYDISPWIGKQYPTNPPEGLREYCDFTITMPESYKTLLPDPKMAIPQFVEVSLPTQSPRLETYPIASQNFCNSLPSLDVDCLRRRTIPSREFIVEAINHSRQALLDGMQSFIDPHFFQDRVPLPFWVLSFWRHMWFALDAQVTWKECNIWLNNQNDNSAREPTIMMCRARMNKLGWNEPIVLNRKCASSLILAELLSNNHISPSLFDMLMINTSQRLGDDLAASELYRVEASSARLMREIEGAWKAQNMLRAPNLQHLTQHMTALKKTMYFGLPAREEGNYIIFSIDFKAQTISHGEQWLFPIDSEILMKVSSKCPRSRIRAYPSYQTDPVVVDTEFPQTIQAA